MAAKKKYDGPDKYHRCRLCAATRIVCEGFYKRDKGMPSCCYECNHEGEAA